QVKNVANWARTNRTGIVYLGGHFNTVKLAALSAEEEPIYKPLRDLLPVEPGDRRKYLDRKTDTAWPLDLGGAPKEMEFVRLGEPDDDILFLKDWDEFFFGARYKLTDKSMESLRAAGVPDATLARIGALRGKEFESRKA